MLIKNGLVFTEECTFKEEDIVITDTKISDVNEDSHPGKSHFNKTSQNEDDVIDAKGMYVVPGFIDIHLHGACGKDFCNGDRKSLKIITEYELLGGITSICPASMTFPEEKLADIFKNIAGYSDPEGSDIVGINMEGPFISAKKCGAQNPDFILKPDIEMFKRLQVASGGLIRLVDIAPEEPGAIEFIEAVKGMVHVSLAHSACDYDTAMNAFGHGADHVTHLYNGMNCFEHRNPGIIGAVSDCENIFTEIIADGIHSAPAAVRMALKLIGSDSLIFISDSMEACGMPDGNYKLGGRDVVKKGNIATVRGTKTLAGSVLNLMEIFRTAVKDIGIPLETALRAVSANPARSIGIYDERGSISQGKKADILILDKELNIISIIKSGRIVMNKIKIGKIC